MSGFARRDGLLHADGVAVPEIAAAVGTPFYLYSSGVLERRYDGFVAALAGRDALVCYALKANSNQAVIRTFARRGAGADVVSVGELERALAAGVPADRIVFAGVGKRRDELARALSVGIRQFNVESVGELEALDSVARDMGRRAPVALRVNPDVDAGTHAKITTGRKENKFGIDIDEAPALYRRMAEMPGIEPTGVAVHIGSQLTDLAPFGRAYARVAGLARTLLADGIALHELDLGGGLGIVYGGETPLDLAAYAALVREATDGLGLTLTFEPGRYLVGPAGILVTRVLYVKSTSTKRFVIVDAAMNDLIRPTLYDAHHAIEPVATVSDGDPTPADVVGPVCESGDYLALGRALPTVRPGDLLAVNSAGAYGAVLSSTYNSRELVAEVMARDGAWSVVRPRLPIHEMIALDRLPGWLDDT